MAVARDWGDSNGTATVFLVLSYNLHCRGRCGTCRPVRDQNCIGRDDAIDHKCIVLGDIVDNLSNRRGSSLWGCSLGMRRDQCTTANACRPIFLRWRRLRRVRLA